MRERPRTTVPALHLLLALRRRPAPLPVLTLTPGDLAAASEPVLDRLPTREEAEADYAAQLSEDRESESRERMQGLCAQIPVQHWEERFCYPNIGTRKLESET